MGRVRFNVEVDIEEKWVDDFCSFLRYIQFCGDVKNSSIVGFYADGKNGFRANFNIDKDFTVKDGEINSMYHAMLNESKNTIKTKRGITLPYISCFDIDRVFDAG